MRTRRRTAGPRFTRAGWLVLAITSAACPRASATPATGSAGTRTRTRSVLVVDAGRRSSAIVLGSQPTSSAQYAALELQYHLEKITRRKLPILSEPAAPASPVRIAVGNTATGKALGFPVDRLQPWEFLVAEKNGTIVLAGGDDPAAETADWGALGLVFNGKPNGTCRAVFEFLEEFCGVHWYLPSEAGMVYPRTAKLVVRMGAPVRRRTDFRSTSLYPYQVNGNMFCQPDTPELTGASVPDSDSEKWRRNLWTIPVKTTDMLPVIEVQRWLLRNKVGGEPYGPNHSFGHWLEEYGREHPDWFSYKSKERIEEILAKGPDKAFNEFHATGEPCLTAPGLFEQELVEAREYRDRPNALSRFFPIVPNDNYVWCQCPTCKPLYDKPVVDCPLWGGATGRASSYVWGFANRVAREIRGTNPDGWVSGIAYHDYMAPPRDFALEPNVAVTICTYLGNWTPALRETAYGLVKAWRDQAKCQWIGLWEYFCYCAMSQYQPMFPRVCPRLLGEDVKKLHQMGVLAEFIETEEVYRFKDAPDRGWAVWSNPIWLYLNVWTRFKLWDDSTRDVSQLLADHYRLFYGPAAKPVQRFFDRIEARVTDLSLRGPKTFNDLSTGKQTADFEYLFPPAVMKELRGYMNQATALATREPFGTRVTWVRDGFLVPQERAAARYLAQRALRPSQRPRDGVCDRVHTPPTVDGDAADPCWSALPANYLNDWRSGAKPGSATWFKMGYDAANLYLLVRCEDATPEKIKANCRNRDDAVYTDDCVEVHLTFDQKRSRRYQLLVNSRGVVQDFQHQLSEAGGDLNDMAWDCEGLVTGAKVDGKGYTVELSVPLQSVGAAVESGTIWYANVAREKYSGGDGETADEMQAWSATQGGFADAKYFGRIVMSDGDGWSLFCSEQTTPPAPILFMVDSKHPWTLTPEAIRAVAEQDRVRYAMKCPAVEEKGRVYGGFGVMLDPPADISQHPTAEIAFTKADRDVLLELLYTYEGVDGKDYSNYFVVSTFGEGSNAPQLVSRALTAGTERQGPAPRLLKSVTVYAVVEGAKTPKDCDFSVQWIRLRKGVAE